MKKAPYLFIGTTGGQAGQSLAAWAFARRFSEGGFSVGFLKPFGATPSPHHGRWGDPDVRLFKDTLKIHAPEEKICPFPGPCDALVGTDGNGFIPEIEQLAVENVSGKDVLLIMGSEHIFFDDSPHLLPDASLISGLDAAMVLVHRYGKISSTVYSLLSIISLLKKRVKGIIINRVPEDHSPALKDRILPILQQANVASTVILPEVPLLTYMSVKRVVQLIEGRIICGEDAADNLVAGMSVGAASLGGDLRIFKRVYNKIVLLCPGEKEKDVAGIILTGNRKPADPVLKTANDLNIPLILVPGDSFSVKEELENGTPPLTPADENKVIHFTAMLDRDDFLNTIIRSLGFNPA